MDGKGQSSQKKRGARDTSGRVLLRITVNLKAADHAASHA
jgi:hypothetical protein